MGKFQLSARMMVVVGLLGCVTIPAQAQGTDTRPVPTVSTAPSAEVVGLIAQLGDPRWAVREKAQKRLAKIADASALPALRKATESTDDEIAIRSKLLLAELLNFTHVVVDAQGRPISGATVSVVYRDGRKTVELKSNGFGGVNVPVEAGNKDARELWFSHPKFGVATGRVPWLRRQVAAGEPAPPIEIRVPLVETGTDAYERALKGVVVGPEGKGLEGARVRCTVVRTPGEGLIQSDLSVQDVVTDREGKFSVYVPDPDPRKERGRLIPPRSRFELIVTAKEGDLFPFAGGMHNTAEQTIRLERPELFHTFEFEAPGGGKIKADELKNISLMYVQAEAGQVGLDEKYVSKGGKLLPGKYVAWRSPTGTRGPITYLPVEVTKESPEKLVFHLPAVMHYRGRIVDGPSGKALGGAFVMGRLAGMRDNPAELTEQEWRELEALPVNPKLEDKRLQRLKGMYAFGMIVRTDESGIFEIEQPADQKIYDVVAFARNRLPYSVRVIQRKAQGKPVTVGDMPLYPAATVTVKAVVDVSRRPVSVMPKWILNQDGQPEWFGAFKKALGSNNVDSKIAYDQWMELNKEERLYVPADVKLSLKFEVPYNEELAAGACEKEIQLPPGKVMDIGVVNFATALVLKVRVVDEAGHPVEGVAVRRMYKGSNTWSVAHNADEDGMVQFFAVANSSGKFGVTDLGKDKMPVVEFDVGTAAPQKAIEITLTAEQVKAVTGAATRPKQ